MEKQNKSIIEYYKILVNKAKYRYLKACKEYTDICESNFRFFVKNGYFNEDSRNREMVAYIKYADKYQQYLIIEERYFRVKGVDQCLEKSL